jgi:Ca-activated chloride channel family protein
MERARNKIHDLLALREGARSGLIAYAGSAHRVTPPTADARILEQMAAALAPDVMPRDGDALAAALKLAQAGIEHSGGRGSILVITDGVSPAQQQALAGLAQAGNLPPIQFLAPVAGIATATQTGVRSAADQLDARLTLISADDSDLRAIERGIVSATTATLADGEQWRDDGWLLLPFIALGVLAWSARGWSVEWT